MTDTFNWDITQIDVDVTNTQLPETAVKIYWIYTIIRDEVHRISTSGCTKLNPPAAETFVSFDKITQDMAISWITSIEDVNTLQSLLTSKLDALLNQPIAHKRPPWLPSRDIIYTAETLINQSKENVLTQIGPTGAI